MTAISVREINTNFPEILKKIRLGEEVGILHGKNKMPVAMIVPYFEKKKAESFKGFKKKFENSVLMLKENELVYFASEPALAKDWLNNEEDEAWKSL
jgi:antitoxin (DNA-binding transcriptional repressor) of toxin-antitoxin stability system